jgi:hypothetical protein
MADQPPEYIQMGNAALGWFSAAMALIEMLVDHLGQQPKHVEALAALKTKHEALGGGTTAEAETSAPESSSPAPSVKAAVAALREAHKQ